MNPKLWNPLCHMYSENAMFRNWRKPMLDNVTEVIENIRCCLNSCSNVCIGFTDLTDLTSHSSRNTLHWKWMTSSVFEIVKMWLKCCAYRKELSCGLVAVHWDGGSDVEGVQHLPAEAVPGYWGELVFHSSLRTTATLTSLKPRKMTK